VTFAAGWRMIQAGGWFGLADDSGRRMIRAGGSLGSWGRWPLGWRDS